MKMNLILIFLVLISCRSITKKTNIDSVVIVIHQSKENLSPLVLFIEVSSEKIILFNTQLNFHPTPIPPDSLKDNNNSLDSEKFFFEIIKLSELEMKLLESKILEFRQNDFEDKMAFVDNGMGITLNIIYNDNEIKEITLINASTSRQKEFFQIIAATIKKHSTHSILLDKYFRVQ